MCHDGSLVWVDNTANPNQPTRHTTGKVCQDSYLLPGRNLHLVVCICQLTFHLPGVHSLKDKRQIVRKLCERIRQRFSISISEVGSQNQHQETKIGLALIGSDERSLVGFLEQILQAIELMQLAPLVDRHTEILHFNDQQTGDSLSALEDELVDDQDSPFGRSRSDPWDYMSSWKQPPTELQRKKGRR